MHPYHFKKLGELGADHGGWFLGELEFGKDSTRFPLPAAYNSLDRQIYVYAAVEQHHSQTDAGEPQMEVSYGFINVNKGERVNEDDLPREVTADVKLLATLLHAGRDREQAPISEADIARFEVDASLMDDQGISTVEIEANRLAKNHFQERASRSLQAGRVKDSTFNFSRFRHYQQAEKTHAERARNSENGQGPAR